MNELITGGADLVRVNPVRCLLPGGERVTVLGSYFWSGAGACVDGLQRQLAGLSVSKKLWTDSPR